MVCAMALTEQDMLIRVPESEYKSILDRERAVADVKTHLHRWIGLIHDVTSYGSNLIPRCFTSSERKLKDVILNRSFAAPSRSDAGRDGCSPHKRRHLRRSPADAGTLRGSCLYRVDYARRLREGRRITFIFTIFAGSVIGPLERNAGLVGAESFLTMMNDDRCACYRCR